MLLAAARWCAGESAAGLTEKWRRLAWLTEKSPGRGDELEIDIVTRVD